ncbi:hypothetical protein JAAARDRAFT_686559 [Jaapia argillacea MUCL 33604]|uniref:tRNA (guanine(10)-N(2))-methyltransferase n=1 Tax=Jaapia argillacea MUCL 33604 TaxID=933084 RepID=A0A067PRK1_9AGAM|nr:hypothetical protein JAAARDRAFT_686559 [Jaapia argillacea MUCL 33604]
MEAQYLFIFAQAHEDFRIPELLSVAKIHGFSITLPDLLEDRDPKRPFMILGLKDEGHARLLARRCILIKSVYEFYARGSTYQELHAQNQARLQLWSRYAADTSFRFLVTAYNHTMSQSQQKEAMESFSYMNFMGKIELKNPEIILGCFEECRWSDTCPRQPGFGGHREEGKFIQVCFGRLIEDGSARSLVRKFDVKKRVYYGNTSMEAEISLLMANQTMAAPGKLMYDPFVGTGSMIYTAAHFGAQLWGSDIDGRQMRGKGTWPGIIRAAAQYGVASRVLDLCTFDVTHNPWRCGDLFDAIVTDPPYGVRAGAKRLGRKKERTPKPDAGAGTDRSTLSDDRPYIPPTKPYELADLASDLVLLARYLLKPSGRLVFFLPTVTDEYQEVDIDTIMCDGMELVANSLQDFGSWGRRLITIQKTTTIPVPPPSFDLLEELVDEEADAGHIPAHKEFRNKYFQGFKKDLSES